MRNISQPKRLLQRLRRSLAVTVGSLVLVLALSLFVEFFIFSTLQNLNKEQLAIQHSTDEILRQMLDQETGVRGYVNARGNQIFLEPYNSGRSGYLAELQTLLNLFATSSDFNDSSVALTSAAKRAEAWYNNFAQIEITRVNNNDFSTAQADATNGKTSFDAFRQAHDDLKQANQHDLNNVQSRVSIINWIVLGFIIVVALGTVLGASLLSNGFAAYLEVQLAKLMNVTTRLQQGDLAARVTDIPPDEIGELGQNFNSMADSLEKQQVVLKERDILESVSQLNNTIISNLELDSLMNKFMSELLYRLKLQLAAVYLYDDATKTLSLATAQGLDPQKFQQSFALGEGAVGQTALNRHTYYITDPEIGESTPGIDESVERPKYKLKTLFGQALPATLFYLPLTRGTTLLGVLCIASIYSISENTRNVLNVLTGNLSTAISNSQAFAHIQKQAEELESRQQALERSNGELSRQRDELSVINTALEEASRVRNQFFSTMSHELRTPLTSIIGFAQILLRQSANATLTNLQKTNMERILKNGQHLLTMVNTVLDLAKIDAGRMDINYKELDMAEFLDSIVDQTQSLALQRGLQLKAQLEPGAERLKVDPDKLRQIIFNLVSNALKFTEKGSVTITATAIPVKIGFQGQFGQSMLAIAVKDTGIGIDLEAQRHIFDEFYQVDNTSTRKYSGSGLGLSIARKLTDLMGGKLDLQSQPGQGSTFTITLPQRPTRYQQTATAPQAHLYPSDEEIAWVTTIPASVTTGVSKNGASNLGADPSELDLELKVGELLVVAIDDEPDVLKIIQSVLEDTPYRVLGINESSRAVAIVSKLQPYAVTLDISMPGLNGWQVLQQLKSNPDTANIPIVMLSVLSDRSAGYVLGASEYLTKPIEPSLLLSTLARLTKRPTPVLTGSVGTILPADYILVVDDEPDICSVLQQTLEAANFTVQTASDGLLALAMVQKSPPRLILLDLMMPAMDGFEVLHNLKSQPATANIPVVILTAKTLTEADYTNLRRGSDYIFQKGRLPLPTLVSKLKELLDAYKIAGL